MGESTALATRQQPENGAIEKAQNTQLTVSPVMLDRENLTFFANMIQAADLVPKGNEPMEVRKSRVMAKICAGVAHGFDPISAQQNLDIIDGKIGLNARGIEVKIARSGKYSTRIEHLDGHGCKLTVLEKNAEGKWLAIGTVEFTEEMAKAAGLASRDMYKKYGPDMYYARAITRVAKRFAPEALDTTGVTYNLAKQQPAPEPETPSEPQQIAEGEISAVEQTTGATASAESVEYSDQEYTGKAADYVDPDIRTPPEEELDVQLSAVEKLRIAVQAKFDEFPKHRQKDLLVGRSTVAKMDETELAEFLMLLEKEQ